jgi:hypothetical protein
MHPWELAERLKQNIARVECGYTVEPDVPKIGW